MKFKSKPMQILFMHQREQTLSHPSIFFLSDSSYHAAALDSSQGLCYVHCRKNTLEHTQSIFFHMLGFTERTGCLQVLISVRTSSLILIKMFKLDYHRSQMLTVLCTEFPFILIQMFYHKRLKGILPQVHHSVRCLHFPRSCPSLTCHLFVFVQLICLDVTLSSLPVPRPFNPHSIQVAI